eukprot:TRINITY_DN4821_c2_g1_i1.p1 TRINITY_DN4821_c2_g1~~TRINITY_DN4821_c2_g1_i1.p1  ORF type:complete len:277 (-),score=42.76 TRINITY_DN4821_c2_g1_i1:200-1030(-)
MFWKRTMISKSFKKKKTMELWNMSYKLKPEKTCICSNLAKSQRMTTDARKAIFCVIMGSEDCLAAKQALLQLPLKKEQQREISRVIIECCLQEKIFNPYYSHLAAGLCGANSKHLATLQFGFWDKLKEIHGKTNKQNDDLESQIRKVRNLANFLATVVIILAKKEGKILLRRFIRKVEAWTQFNQRESMFWIIFFQRLFLWGQEGEGGGGVGVGLKDLLFDVKEDQILCEGLMFFLSVQFKKWLRDGQNSDQNKNQRDQLSRNWKLAVHTLSGDDE